MAINGEKHECGGIPTSIMPAALGQLSSESPGWSLSQKNPQNY